MTSKEIGKLLKEHPEALTDRIIFIGLLKDMYPNEKAKINILANAFDLGAVKTLLDKQKPDEFFTERITNGLVNNYGIDREKARWAANLFKEVDNIVDRIPKTDLIKYEAEFEEYKKEIENSYKQRVEEIYQKTELRKNAILDIASNNSYSKIEKYAVKKYISEFYELVNSQEKEEINHTRIIFANYQKSIQTAIDNMWKTIATSDEDNTRADLIQLDEPIIVLKKSFNDENFANEYINNFRKLLGDKSINVAKTLKLKRIILTIVISVITFPILLAIIFEIIIPSKQINKAEKLIENNKYEEALRILEENAPYQNKAKELLISSKYDYAILLLDDEQYDKAYEYLEQISETDSANELLCSSKYQRANEYIKNGDYEFGYELLDSIPNYKDSKDIVLESLYSRAMELHDNDNFEKAYELLEQAGTYKNADIFICESKYTRSQQLIKQKNYVDAIALLNSIKDYKDSRNIILEISYKYAKELYEKKDYNESNTIFTALGDYKDSKSFIHTHKFKAKAVQIGSCTQDEIIEFKCECGYSYQEIKKANGHVLSVATCTEGPRCKKCGIVVGKPLGHTSEIGICDRCGKNVFKGQHVNGYGTYDIPVYLGKGNFKLYFWASDESDNRYYNNGYHILDVYIKSNSNNKRHNIIQYGAPWDYDETYDITGPFDGYIQIETSDKEAYWNVDITAKN